MFREAGPDFAFPNQGYAASPKTPPRAPAGATLPLAGEGENRCGRPLFPAETRPSRRRRISLVLKSGYITDNPEFAMLSLIAEHRAEIAALCRRFGVRRLAVFGSAARGADFDPARSDVDFLVEFAAHDGDFARLSGLQGGAGSLTRAARRSCRPQGDRG